MLKVSESANFQVLKVTESANFQVLKVTESANFCLCQTFTVIKNTKATMDSSTVAFVIFLCV